MTFFTKAQTEQLLANCQEQITNNDAGHSDIDFEPVVKLFSVLRLDGLFEHPALARQR